MLYSITLMKDSHDQERRGLWLSIVGAVFMAVLGIGFAILTSSDTVLLDGLFSLVGCVVGMLALRVGTLVIRSHERVAAGRLCRFWQLLSDLGRDELATIGTKTEGLRQSTATR